MEQIEDKYVALAKNAFASEVSISKHAYIDICGDLIAGMVLSQIMYWFTPDKNGKSKIRIFKEDGSWLAKSRDDWYEELRISPKQSDRALKILYEKGLIEKKLYKFDGTPTQHIRPIWNKVHQLIERWISDKAEEFRLADHAKTSISTKGKNPFSPKGEIDFDQRDKSLTEITTEITSKTTNKQNKESVSSKPDESVFPEEENSFSNNHADSIGIKFPDIEIAAGKWEWKSDRSYTDYIEKVLPKFIKEYSSRWGHRSDNAYKVHIRVISNFFKLYREVNGFYHPWYTLQSIEKAFDNLYEYFSDRIKVDELNEYMDSYFKKKSLRKKGFLVFSSENVLKYLDAEFSQDYSLITEWD